MNNVNRKFGRSPDGKRIVYFKGYIDTDDGIILNPSDDQILGLAHQYRVIDEIPQKEGFYYTPDGWKENDETQEVARVFKEHKVEPSFEQYDGVMEDHIRTTREERGYTTREPSAYAGSSVPRFAQDAKDWQKFLDETMLYGAKVRDEYASTGIAPTLEEFKAGLPAVAWTYDEES